MQILEKHPVPKCEFRPVKINRAASGASEKKRALCRPAGVRKGDQQKKSREPVLDLPPAPEIKVGSGNENIHASGAENKTCLR